MTNFNYINLLNTLSTNYNLSMEMLTNLHMMYGHGNETQNLHCPSIQMPLANIISMILYTIVCVLGLLGNTLVIYVVLRFSNMQVRRASNSRRNPTCLLFLSCLFSFPKQTYQTITNIFILNLAFADMCFLIGIPFLITTMYLGDWSFGKGMCKAYMVSTSITQFTSSIFLFIMSADRYLAVCHPISSPRYRTPFISKVVSVLAWTMSALIMLPVMLYANTIEKDSKQKASCIIEWPQSEEAGGGSGTTFILYSLILGFAIPLSLILGFYYLVLKKLRTVGPKNKSKEKKRSHRKVTKLVLTVITVYVLCWLPYWVGQLALIHSPPDLCKSRLEITIFVLVGCLGYSNSAMNPILYAFLSENFKKSFLKACTCATGNDPNGQLQFENSFFPRFVKSTNNNSARPGSTSRPPQNRTLAVAAGPQEHPTISRATTTVVAGKSPQVTETATAALENVTVAEKQIYESNNNNEARPPVLHTDL